MQRPKVIPCSPGPALGLLLMAALSAVPLQAASPEPAPKPEPSTSVSSRTETAPALAIVVNKSAILRLDAPAVRISVGNPAVADINPISSREIIVLGKSIGTTNLIVWDKAGVATMRDVIITPEPVIPVPPPPSVQRDSVEVIKGLNKSNMEF